MNFDQKKNANLRSTTWFLGVLLATPCVASSSKSPAVPDFLSVGNHIEEVRLFKKGQIQKKKAVYPSRISIDVFEGKLEGFVVYYGKEVTFDDLVDAIDGREKQSAVGIDMRKFGVSCWRNEKGRYALQVAVSDDEQFASQLVCIWLDRKSPVTYEAKEMLKGVIQGGKHKPGTTD